MRNWIGAGVLMALAGCAQGGPKPPPLAGTFVAEDIGGGGVIDNLQVTVAFDPATQRVSGRSGCNRYSGGYTATASAIKFTPLAGTRMMCPPALMDTEAKFLVIMAAVNSWRIDATGLLTLAADDGRAIKLRRAG